VRWNVLAEQLKNISVHVSTVKNISVDVSTVEQMQCVLQ